MTHSRDSSSDSRGSFGALIRSHGIIKRPQLFLYFITFVLSFSRSISISISIIIIIIVIVVSLYQMCLLIRIRRLLSISCASGIQSKFHPFSVFLSLYLLLFTAIFSPLSLCIWQQKENSPFSKLAASKQLATCSLQFNLTRLLSPTRIAG